VIERAIPVPVVGIRRIVAVVAGIIGVRPIMAVRHAASMITVEATAAAARNGNDV
jgi:hypothetical protein